MICKCSLRCLFLTLTLISQQSSLLAAGSCEKDGEIIFTKDCIAAMLKEREQQQAAGKHTHLTATDTPLEKKAPSPTAIQPDADSARAQSGTAAQPATEPDAPAIDNSRPLQQQAPSTLDTPSARSVSTQITPQPPATGALTINNCSAQTFVEAAQRDDLLALQSCNPDSRLLAAVDSRRPYRGRTALHWAASNNHLSVARYLLDAAPPIRARSRADFGAFPIHLAAEHGHIPMLKLLLSTGSSVAATDLLKQTPLHRAAKNGNLDAVQLLLNNGASIETRDRIGRTTLIAASHGKNPALIKWLLERGANVNAQTVSGMTALHVSSKRSAQITALLLDSGADIDPADNAGKTPLTSLISSNIFKHWPNIQLLIKRGASLTKTDSKGKQAIDLSLAANHLPLFKLLLDKGVDAGHLQLYQLQGKTEFIRLLRNYGLL